MIAFHIARYGCHNSANCVETVSDTAKPGASPDGLVGEFPMAV